MTRGRGSANRSRGSPAQASTRFRRATAIERNRLARRLEKAQARVGKLARELSGAALEVVEITSRIATLGAFLDEEATVETAQGPSRSCSEALSGRSIREVAVKVLLGRGSTSGPIHYRQWLALLETAGRQVAGKRPDAVFLNQVSRSPLVRAAGRAGFYELDLDAPQHLSERVRELQRSLGALLSEEPSRAEEVAEHTARVHELSLEIGRRQRSFEEALALLTPQPEAIFGPEEDSAKPTLVGAS